MDKLIITAALTGSVPTKQQNPHLPVTPEEIAEAALGCRRAGASIVHVHARDREGKATLDPDVFESIYHAIRTACPDLIIQISTGGRAGSDPQRRAEPVLRIKPEMASLTTGSVNFPDAVYENSNETVELLARAEQQAGAKPELEIFDTGMIGLGVRLSQMGLVSPPLYFNFVLGLAGGTQPATPKQLLHLVESIPSGARWNVSAIGAHQLPMNLLGIIMGGHVRVGLEDNLYYRRGVLATNEMLVERIARLAKELGREVATPDQARQILGLHAPSG